MKSVRISALIAVLVVVTACTGYTPRTYVDAKELDNGRPGLFSGPDGAFSVFAATAGAGEKTDRR